MGTLRVPGWDQPAIEERKRAVFRAMILLCVGLVLAPGALAAPASAPRAASGASSRPMSARTLNRSPAPQPRGGPGTLGGYLQRPPASRRVPYPDGYYLAPYYGS